MSAVSLSLAGPLDVDRVAALVAAYHAFEGVSVAHGDLIGAFSPLLGESQFGRLWLIRADTQVVGYLAVCFGYSIEFGGRDAFVDEFYLDEAHRGQGIGAQALGLVKQAVAELGIKALHLEVARGNERAQRLYRRLGFDTREKYFLMTAQLG